ncbi:hypothetical protein PGT21_011152 [Puccinia graminis f. sp. tritici]|uniref:Uncharacterized protein n=1 Tax=Puccinia graminis f. sp. tritici TaxID=56615 RepID=A0A5B0M3R8_PUCGR|nr:hypothetical protein PGT21_011152 [Puccinia graminis f. sp. tritici]KAA1070889.1 hypothetical protein PGTUg99_002452 [Puccinia graminis f. sp. tritici]
MSLFQVGPIIYLTPIHAVIARLAQSVEHSAFTYGRVICIRVLDSPVSRSPGSAPHDRQRAEYTEMSGVRAPHWALLFALFLEVHQRMDSDCLHLVHQPTLEDFPLV